MLRLLHVSTFAFHVFHGRPPPYAVLSHTWGSDQDEVTFRDMEEATAASRPAWRHKVQPFAHKARANGYQYIWVDTCCINKSDAVELQEAINSMYRWYYGAATCYAVLLDVPGSDVDPAAVQTSRFARSRWFTRGWTLQELLAPREVVFFNAAWRELGTRASLAPLVSDITGIDLAYLQSRDNVRWASVAERMHWASRRETRRPEDRSYSLLGLFGVSMAMIYGEGAEEAFLRLQELIIKRVHDDSILAWGADPSAPADSVVDGAPDSLLARSPSDFMFSSGIKTWIGNESKVDAARSCIFNSSSAAMQINGRITRDAPGIGRLWLHCRKAHANNGNASAVSIPIAWASNGRGVNYYRRQSGRIGLHPDVAATYDIPEERITVSTYNALVQPVPTPEGPPGEFHIGCPQNMRITECCPASAWDSDRSAFVFDAGPVMMAVRLSWAAETAAAGDGKDYIVIIVSPTRTFTPAAARWLVLQDTQGVALEIVTSAWMGFRDACKADALPFGQALVARAGVSVQTTCSGSGGSGSATADSCQFELTIGPGARGRSGSTSASASTFYSVSDEMAYLAKQRRAPAPRAPPSTTTVLGARSPNVPTPDSRGPAKPVGANPGRPAPSTAAPTISPSQRPERRFHMWGRSK